MDSWNNYGHNHYGGDGGSSSGSRQNSEILTEDTDDFMIGDVVYVGGVKRGKLIFIGQTHFGQGDWAGVALDTPTGKNDGMVSGLRYFQCQPMHGTFARLNRLSRHRLYPEDTEDYQEEPYWRENSPPTRASYRRSTSPTFSSQNFRKSKSPSPVPSSGGGQSSRGRTKSPSPFKDSTAPLRLGDRVIVASLGGSKLGTLRFLGQTMFAPGEWAGVELDGPVGKNDGSVGLNRYFTCAEKFGLFAPVSKVSSSPANRHTTPCPLHQNLDRCSCTESSLYYPGNSNYNSNYTTNYAQRTTTYREGSYDSDYF